VHKTSLDKILKTLESRKLIKAVKTIANKNRKVFMLYDMMPSAEITGGPWYSEQEFDHAFVESLSKFVYQCVATLKMASLDMLTEKVRISGVSKVPLGPEHVLSIVTTLVYDGRLEEVRAPKRAMQGRGRYSA
jgi:DNA-directed RNA polymerase III subunit RPC6